jgi:hypothetical protein
MSFIRRKGAGPARTKQCQSTEKWARLSQQGFKWSKQPLAADTKNLTYVSTESLRSLLTMRLRARVARLGEISPIGQMFYLDRLFKITDVAQCLAYFCPR